MILIETLEKICRWYERAMYVLYTVNGKSAAELKKSIKPNQDVINEMAMKFEPLPLSLYQTYKSDISRLNKAEQEYYKEQVRDLYNTAQFFIRACYDDYINRIEAENPYRVEPDLWAISYIKNKVWTDANKIKYSLEFKEDLQKLTSLLFSNEKEKGEYERKTTRLEDHIEELVIKFFLEAEEKLKAEGNIPKIRYAAFLDYLFQRKYFTSKKDRIKTCLSLSRRQEYGGVEEYLFKASKKNDREKHINNKVANKPPLKSYFPPK
jgi:hypothetical protein